MVRAEGMLEDDVTDDPKLLNSDPSGNMTGSVTTLNESDIDLHFVNESMFNIALIFIILNQYHIQ